MAERKLALVTGASGGLGLEFAKLLAADDYDLAIVARSGDKLERIAQELRAARGVTVTPIAQDLGVAGAVDTIAALVPRCDVLVNNAGFASNGRFDSLAPSGIREELMLDIVTLTELTRVYLPGMIERGSGRVLNVASTAGFLPGPFMAVYYAAKAYVISFTEALSEELRGTGVTATVLCPGATATGFQARAEMERSMLFTRTPVADAASVARAGYRSMLRGKRMEIPGFSNKLVAMSPAFSPRGLLLRISRKLVEPSR